MFSGITNNQETIARKNLKRIAQNNLENIPQNNLKNNIKNVPQNSLEAIAQSIFQKHGVVLVTFINRAYLPFAHSWFCNTQPFGIHSKVLVFTTDAASQETLQRRWPEVSTVSLNISSLSEDQTYRKAGYVRVTVERARSVNRLLKIGVRVFLFEFDCVWLSNPLPTVLAFQRKGDIVATKVGGRDAMATGFLLLNPTSSTVNLWGRFTEKMEDIMSELSDLDNDDKVKNTILDQVILWRLVRTGFAGIRVAYLPAEAFADGEWYKQPRHVRREGPRPIIINNNFIKGNAKKIKRARKFGHWFLDTDAAADDVCDVDAVDAVLSDDG
ncbi:hypothetical protein BaRGS_00017574 [Batillaria attramentaria]|uniref:Nucleotide-diphospho-sugar transferase domain-containing protein n=1 Tax=Batillaria attramentaria TaxID=370345 RepID=A0ABD0KVL0_9CAEN|nr:hypothetical protein BaRGS_013305 [Batillaria attramentaria]